MLTTGVKHKLSLAYGICSVEEHSEGVGTVIDFCHNLELHAALKVGHLTGFPVKRKRLTCRLVAHLGDLEVSIYCLDDK